MERLTSLNKRPKTEDRVECLPAGDGLPIWSTIPLDAKLPMMRNPKGSVTLFTTKLGEPKHTCKQENDFDLRDPNGMYVCNEYQPLHDPALKAHFKSGVMRRHLIKKGFISENGRVLCTLKEFNNYRRYLRHVFFLEIAKERKEELWQIHKQASVQKDPNPRGTLSHGTVVRKRLQKQREEARNKRQNNFLIKEEQLDKRLQDLKEDMAKRDQKRREEAARRKQNVNRNLQEVYDRKLILMNKWRQQDRSRTKLIEDREAQQTVQAEMECIARWNERKKAQEAMLAKDEAILKKDEDQRLQNINKREKLISNQRLVQERKLETLKQETREEKARRDARYAKRFEEKLASGDYRIWTKRRDKRRSRGKNFCSTWKLEDVLNNLTLSDVEKQTRGASLMAVLEALDSPVDIVTEQEEQELEELHAQAKQIVQGVITRVTDELEELHGQAQEIVQGVITRVTDEIYPAYLRLLEADEGEAAMKSRSVRFCSDEDQIETYTSSMESREELFDAEEGYMRPVSEHILTPCASQLEIQKLEAEAILGSPEVGDKLTSVSFVETLLLRLLDDLNGGRLSNDDIMKLASYSMDILQSTDLKDRTLLEAQEELDTDGPYQASSSSSIIAKKMVDFTLGKILADIQSGHVHPDDLASLTVSLLDDTSPSLGSSASISVSDADIDSYIEETLRAATSSALDPRDDSPVCEALLDDFMVSTLKNLIADIENEVLSKSQIEKLATSVKDETKSILSVEDGEDLGDSKALQKVLFELLHELQDGKVDIQTMYQLVFAIVYSYNMIKAPSTPCFESRISDMMRDLLYTAEQKAAAGEMDDMNVHIIHEANQRLSNTTLDVGQIEQISSSIIGTISKPEVVCRTTTSDIARSIVEDALKRAQQMLENENMGASITQGVQNVAEAVIVTTSGEENIEWSTGVDVDDTLVEVLKNLRATVTDMNMLEQSDIDDIDDLIAQILDKDIGSEQVKEMAISVARVLKSPVKSQSSMSACLLVADTLRKVNHDLMQGSLEENVLKEMIDVVSMSFRAARAADVHSPSMLNALSSFLNTVLSFVSNKVQSGEYGESDIRELSKAMKENINQQDILIGLKKSVFDEVAESCLTPTPEQEAQIVYQNMETQTEEHSVEQDTNEAETVLQHFQTLLDNIESGQISTHTLGTLGKRLIKCGKSLLENLSGYSSAFLTPGSDVIADDLIEEVIRTLHMEITRGTLTQENVKELTKTILSSTSSQSQLAEELVCHTIRGIHQDIERGYDPSRLPSMPSFEKSTSGSSKSHLAEQLVGHTIHGIHRDIERGHDPSRLPSVPSFDHSQTSSSKTHIAEQLVGHTIRGIHRDIERGHLPSRLPSVPSFEHSPSASTVASHIVLQTIDAVQRDLSHAAFSGSAIISLASSIIPLISDDLEKLDDIPLELEKVKPTIQAIIRCLKADRIDRSDAEKMFITILENYKYFVAARNTKSVDQLSDENKLLVHDLVDETLRNIERSIHHGKMYEKEFSIPSLPTSEDTSFVVDELVNLCLDTIKQDLRGEDILRGRQYTDISDFILEIVLKLREELSEGTISNLSMAHFFHAISSDLTELKNLEANALDNLSEVIDDIKMNGNQSIYIHRILDTYLSTEQVEESIFSDPVKAVESILISVSSDILTKFVKATLQNILIEIREGDFNVEKRPSVFSIQSASSLIAENVIKEVVSRIKEDMTKSVHKIHGHVNKQEFERAASKLLCESPTSNVTPTSEEPPKKNQSSSSKSKTSVHSKDIEDIVLETLHNIVSNLRFDQSVHAHKAAKSTDDHSSDMSSEIQDFVLNALQNIVTDLQDRRSQMELGINKPGSKEGSCIELITGESREANAYVNEVLQNVLTDMKQELASRNLEGNSNDESIGSDSEKLETFILGSLQNATKDTNSKHDLIQLEPNQRKDVKQIVIESIVATLNNVKESKLSLEDLHAVYEAYHKSLDEPKVQVNSIQDLKEQVIGTLEKVLEQVQDVGVDEACLNRIATQVATLGMDNGILARKSPDYAVSTLSVSSSQINDLVKDVISKISQQMLAESDETHHQSSGPEEAQQAGEDETNKNFNRKKSASSCRTEVSKPDIRDYKTNSKKLLADTKKTPKLVENQKQITDRHTQVKKSSKDSLPKQSPLVPTTSSDRRVKCPKKPDRIMYPKQRMDNREITKPPTPSLNKQTKGGPYLKSELPSVRKAHVAKPSKSEQAPKRTIIKTQTYGSSPAINDQKQVRRKTEKKPKNKDGRCEEIKPRDEDSAVLKSICGAHKTKISIREDQN